MYKVLHIFSGYGGGISSLVLNLIENKTEEFQFDLLAFSYENGENFVKRMEDMGCRCYEMPRIPVCGFRAFYEFVNKLMTAGKYDAIHCHITGYSAFPFYKIAKKAGTKIFVLHAHTTQYDSKIDRIPLIYKLNQLINYKIASVYFTCSDMAANYIYGQQYLKKRPAILIPNGMDAERYSCIITDVQKDAYRKEFGLSVDTKVLLHVGRFAFAKNYKFIIDIMKQLKEKCKNAILIFVGSGALLENVQKAVRDNDLETVVLFAGRRLDIPQLMQFADLMILPSLYEGLPTVAVECQASGTPMLLANTITTQADMGLGLTEYLSIDNSQLWVDKIMLCFNSPHQSPNKCLSVISENGFTSKAAGKRYCTELRLLLQDLNR